MSFEIRRIRAGTVAVNRLDGERLRIGRGTNADLAFDDAAVDLEHAVIARDGVSWALTDRDSVSGTWVNGRRIQTVRLAEGDLVEIGDHRIRVVDVGEQPVLEVLVAGDAATRRPAPAAEVAPVDFAAAHRLQQGWLSKAGLSLVAVLGTVVVLLAVSVSGRTVAFRPGPVSEAHARSIGARACLDCHQPWRGPVDTQCAECHRQSSHQPEIRLTQLEPAPCGSCHTEHRRLPRLQLVPDAACVSCHGDIELPPGVEPRFAARVTGFGTDHPELSLTVEDASGENGESRRLPLTDPAARRSDPGTLELDHQYHLKPGLLGPEGREQLVCTDCHEPGGSDGHLQTVDFERHCQRCHELGFDVGGRAQERAPHLEPRFVNAYLLQVFSRDPEFDALSLDERRRRIIQDPTGGRRFGPTPSVIGQANDAERKLYANQCSDCHAVDLTGALPVVEPVRVTADWLPHAEFLHERHGESLGLSCEDCHGEARTSTETADVLLPGIETCRGCHGQGTVTAGDTDLAEAGSRVPSACIACHRYHGQGAEEGATNG